MNTGQKKNKYKRETVNISITISPDLLAQIDEEIEKEDSTRSQFFRRLAKQDLKKAAA